MCSIICSTLVKLITCLHNYLYMYMINLCIHTLHQMSQVYITVYIYTYITAACVCFRYRAVGEVYYIISHCVYSRGKWTGSNATLHGTRYPVPPGNG